MIETVQEWSVSEARRIALVAQCIPEDMRGEYIAQSMVEAISEFVDLARTES